VLMGTGDGGLLTAGRTWSAGDPNPGSVLAVAARGSTLVALAWSNRDTSTDRLYVTDDDTTWTEPPFPYPPRRFAAVVATIGGSWPAAPTASPTTTESAFRSVPAHTDAVLSLPPGASYTFTYESPYPRMSSGKAHRNAGYASCRAPRGGVGGPLTGLAAWEIRRDAGSVQRIRRAYCTLIPLLGSMNRVC
jgi:hypothetical protein